MSWVDSEPLLARIREDRDIWPPLYQLAVDLLLAVENGEKSAEEAKAEWDEMRDG